MRLIILSLLLLWSNCFGQAFRFCDTPWVGAVGTRSSPNAGLNAGLVAYWRFDEQITNGTRADSVAGVHPLTDHGNTAFTNGIFNSAARAINNSYLTAADHADFSGGGSFSVQIYFKYHTAVDNTAYMAKWGTVNEWVLWYNAGSWQFLLQKFDNSVASAVTTSTTLLVDQWNHVCFGLDTTNQVMWIQHNGNTRTSVPYTTACRDTTEPISFFQYSEGGGTSFLGFIDECGYWKRVLTSAEVITLWNGANGLTYPY